MTFQEKLVKLRKLKGITQDEFASAVGVSRQSVYKWESGQSYPEVSKLIEIKKLFEISIDDLLDDNYEVILPEKKKKRLSRQDKERIEREVEAELITESAPTAEPVAEPVAETAPTAEEAPVAEEAAVEEAPVTEPVVEEKKEEPKKKGFFERLFGGFWNK